MGKYADLFEPAVTGEAKGKYADLFDEAIPTYEPQVVTSDGITPEEQSTLAAPEGSPQREEINRAVAGNIFTPPGAFAREPKLSELIEGLGVLRRPEVEIPREIPAPEVSESLREQFERGGILGALHTPSPAFIRGVEDPIRAAIPKSDVELARMIAELVPATGAVEHLIETGKGISELSKGKPLQEVLEEKYGPQKTFPEYTAEDWGKLTGETGMAAAMGIPIFRGLRAAYRPPGGLRTTPLEMPELPPSRTLGPGTIAGDVSAAIKRMEGEPTLAERITQPRVEPAPQEPLAPVTPETPPTPEAAPTGVNVGDTIQWTQQAMTGEKTFPTGKVTAIHQEPGMKALYEVEGQSDFVREDQARPVAVPEQQPARAGPVEVPVQHGEFAKPGYTAVETPPAVPETPSRAGPAEPPVAEPAALTPELVIPPEDLPYAGGGEPIPHGFSDQPHVSAIANRFTAERAAKGELGEIQPGGTISTMDLVHRGLKMTPEQVNESVSRIMQGGDVPINDAAAIRGEEARLSQRSNEASRAARASKSPEAQLAADNAFKDLMDFHNGPVAQAKRNWHIQGKGMQGEIPVDLSTLNGMREAWLKDTGKAPPAHLEPKLQKAADKLAKAIDEELGATRRGGEAIERITRGRKLPSYDDVRNSIAERLKEMPCK